jgi:hypothetical protein
MSDSAQPAQRPASVWTPGFAWECRDRRSRPANYRPCALAFSATMGKVTFPIAYFMSFVLA